VRASVRAAWIAYNRDLEGRFRWPYLDVVGLITTGVGNLCDDWATFRALPWQHKAHGGPATPAEVRQEYDHLRAQFCGVRGGGKGVCAWEAAGKGLCYAHAGAWGLGATTFLRLSDANIDALIMRVLDLKIEQMRQDYPDWDAWPADAQAGTMSLCWAMGTEFVARYGFTNFDRAVKRQDWAAAALSCGMSSASNAGISERNKRNALCFRNAAASVRYGVDPEVLHWPNALLIAPSEAAPTQPELPDAPETMPELVGPQGTAEGLAEWAIEQHRRDRGEGS
jgi:GH24 family phage-related lysozyme (muramidase)